MALLLLTGCTNNPSSNNWSRYTKTTNHIIKGVPFYCQVGLLPTGCELISSKMVLEYLTNTEISIDTIVDNTLCTDIKYSKGVYYAPSPDYAFIGDPYDEHGYGCYPPVIVNTCNSLLDHYEAIDTTGTSIESLCKDSIDSDIPVLLWVTIGLKESSNGNEWYLTDEAGSITDNKFIWKKPEHCLVLIGYDKDYYYCSDPLMKASAVKYEKELVEKRFIEMGEKSVSFTIVQ